jgi:deoxyadenosine/deoxycytidine kinase
MTDEVASHMTLVSCHTIAFQLRFWVIFTEQMVIMDRSVFGDSVFAEVGYMEGNISDEGYKSYQELRQKTFKILPFPDVFIFLDAPPSCCHQRIMSRGRVSDLQ